MTCVQVRMAEGGLTKNWKRKKEQCMIFSNIAVWLGTEKVQPLSMVTDQKIVINQ